MSEYKAWGIIILVLLIAFLWRNSFTTTSETEQNIAAYFGLSLVIPVVVVFIIGLAYGLLTSWIFWSILIAYILYKIGGSGHDRPF